MDTQIRDTLMKLASSIETLANSIEKDAEVSNSFQSKTASSRDFGFGGVSDIPDRDDPFTSFILS